MLSVKNLATLIIVLRLALSPLKKNLLLLILLRGKEKTLFEFTSLKNGPDLHFMRISGVMFHRTQYSCILLTTEYKIVFVVQKIHSEHCKSLQLAPGSSNKCMRQMRQRWQPCGITCTVKLIVI